MGMGPKIELTAEQCEDVILDELEDMLMNPEGVPEKTYKAIKRTYKWYSPAHRQNSFLRTLSNDFE